MRLRLYETVRFLLLRIEEGGEDILKVSPDKRRDAIAAMAGLLLNPLPCGEGGQTRSNMVVRVLWDHRRRLTLFDGRLSGTSRDAVMGVAVDGGIFAQHLYFVCFKKRQIGRWQTHHAKQSSLV